MKISDHGRIAIQAEIALQADLPLNLLVIATKPCYIKLASLVKTLRKRQIPTLIIDVGQHYDEVLVGAAREFDYQNEIDIFLDIRGGLLTRTSELAMHVQRIHEHLISRWPTLRAVPVVSGDTSTSGTFPIFWYLHTGIRSVHVEAGLRSMSPFAAEVEVNFDAVVEQRELPWRFVPDEPFPEAVDTRLTSVVSSQLMAPVQRNVKALLREGYPCSLISLTGSLSADAVLLARAHFKQSTILESHPLLADGRRWLRVDIHRRENMTVPRIEAVVSGLCKLSQTGVPIVFILTNQFRFALQRHPEQQWLKRLQLAGVQCQDLWPSYLDVVAFISSSRCLALYTDSGGLQEEAHLLGVPCMTCRFSTDRPETVLDAVGNMLVPPVSGDLVARAIGWFLDKSQSCTPGSMYGEHVAERIADRLALASLSIDG